MKLLMCTACAVIFAGPLVAATAGQSALVATPAQQLRPGPPCTPVAEIVAGETSTTGTATPANHDVCVRAHVYDVVELADGTRFLDVCPGTVPDEDCRFILLSRPADREEVGDLARYRGQDIQLRGIVRPMHGRMGMVISHARQFRGGPEKFRPNPRLLREFDGESDELPVRDPNLAPAGHHRSFMNSRVRESVPPVKP